MVVILLINFIIDIYKTYKKINIDWANSYRADLIYNYTDFILKDLKKIKIKGLILFIITLKILKIILLIQTIFFFIFFTKIVLGIKTNISSRGFFVDIFINNSKIMAYLFIYNIKNFKITRRLILVWILNLNNIFLWGYPRFIMNNAFVIVKFLISIKEGPKVFTSKDYIKFILYLQKNFFTDSIEKYKELINK